MTPIETVRQCILRSPDTPEKIAKRAGIAHSTLYRLVKNPNVKLNDKSLTRLCKIFNLELVAVDDEEAVLLANHRVERMNRAEAAGHS